MQQQLEIQYSIAHASESFATPEESGSSTTLQNPHETIVSEMMHKIRATRKFLDKSSVFSDIARYLNSNVVEFDKKKRD